MNPQVINLESGGQLLITDHGGSLEFAWRADEWSTWGRPSYLTKGA